jgi:cellulose synthase/poly-beta-1,6-N-acetylglucosamine synthase-like glycosyltransferase
MFNLPDLALSAWHDPWLGLLALLITSWVANADFHRRFQASIRSAPRLELLKTQPKDLPTISVIIPAYNEAVNIEPCLTAVVANKLSDPQRLQVIVADDESTDETLALASKLADQDPRICVFTVPPRPSDRPWRGKNWACYQAAKQATGDYLLFVDADVRLQPEAIACALTNAQIYQSDLLSCAPKIICDCFAEWLVQPLMALLIAVGFSFEGVNDPAQLDRAAAAGPFMLFRRTAYEQIGGHQGVAADPVEDFALAQQIKSQGLTLRYVLGLEIASVRMYRSFGDLWEGWTKNYHLAGGRNIVLTLASAVAIALLFVVPWLGLAIGAVGLVVHAPHAGLAMLFAMIAVALQIYMRLAAAKLVDQPVRYLWLGWLGGGLISAIAIVSLIKTETGWGWTWRGRSLAQ